MTSQRGLTTLSMDQTEASWALPATPAERMPRPGEPFEGEVACLCGGHRRAILPNTAAHPVWRCLHCGFLSNLRPHLRPRRRRCTPPRGARPLESRAIQWPLHLAVQPSPTHAS